MRACGLAILKHGAENGFLVWEAGVPRLLLSEDVDTVRTVRPHWSTIAAVLKRAEKFRAQLLVADVHPFCRYRDSRWTPPGTCPSCGGKVGEHELRCPLCALAAELALHAPEQGDGVALPLQEDLQ